MSEPRPAPSFLDRLRRFDPVALPIAIAALVLVGAVAWLLGRPLPPPQPLAAGADPALAQEVAALRSRLEAMPARLAALEARPVQAAPDLAPLRAQLAAAESRAQAAERRIAELAARPALDPAAFATRAALEQLSARVEAMARDAQAAATGREQRQAATEQAIAAFAGRVAANEVGIGQRGQAIDLLAGRLAELERQFAARIGPLEQRVGQRGDAVEQVERRLAALEGAAQRLAALEGRSARLAALDAVQLALEAGLPLGPALRPLADPPRALTRFAETAPPTMPQLRLGFEEAARAALAASEPARAGTLLEGATQRLQGLITIRRGEEVLWGDAAAAEVERARKALEAGDLAVALRHLARLSAPARQAMAGWTGQAEALLAAREALRLMAAG